ncbi:ATPase component of ABC transporters with duplicated ATPase domain, partial [Acidovorax sp. CF316]|uniref:translation initiation factor IF-2 associated domain-containing protein n=1 Tax=Acidovorax sp. CF316 TaxID=1144317 RepID=UPI00026BDBC4
MSSNTVAEFASELKKSPETLLDQLKAAGVGKAAPSDALTESDKQKLLVYLQNSHGTAAVDRKKITLTKKSTSEIKQADATGKARTIQVEVRKKRTFIKRDDGVEGSPESEDTVVEEAAVSSEDLELSRREEEARRQAELIRRQETELAEKRAEREAREQREREAEERAAAYAAQEAEKKAQASAVKQEATREQAAEAAARTAAQVEAREKAAAESKARSDEESARAADLDARRRKAEAEAAAIRSMMATPKKAVMVAKKPEEPKPVAKPALAGDAKKGTLHKPAVGTGTGPARPGAPATAAAPGA